MGVVEIMLLIYMIASLWFVKILYRNRWDEEFDEKMKYMDFSFKLSKDNLILFEKNLNLSKENKKLKEELNKSKNRVAKVIKEEKTNEDI